MHTKTLITIFFLLQHFLCSQSFVALSEKALNRIYPFDIKTSYKLFTIPKADKKRIEQKYRQAFFRKELYTWTFSLDSIQYYAVLDNVIGKVQPMTFLVIYKASGEIDFVELLKYREDHGYEVKRPSFLKQFKGKKLKENYKINKTIKNISGATISVRNLTKAINKLSALFPLIKKAFK